MRRGVVDELVEPEGIAHVSQVVVEQQCVILDVRGTTEFLTKDFSRRPGRDLAVHDELHDRAGLCDTTSWLGQLPRVIAHHAADYLRMWHPG